MGGGICTNTYVLMTARKKAKLKDILRENNRGNFGALDMQEVTCFLRPEKGQEIPDKE